MDFLDKAKELLDGAVPIVEQTPELVEACKELVGETRSLVAKAKKTLERVDAILDKGPALADQLGALMKAHTELAPVLHPLSLTKRPVPPQRDASRAWPSIVAGRSKLSITAGHSWRCTFGGAMHCTPRTTRSESSSSQ